MILPIGKFGSMITASGKRWRESCSGNSSYTRTVSTYYYKKVICERKRKTMRELDWNATLNTDFALGIKILSSRSKYILLFKYWKTVYCIKKLKISYQILYY